MKEVVLELMFEKCVCFDCVEMEGWEVKVKNKGIEWES